MRTLLFAIALTVFAAGGIAAAPYDRIYVFGDSYSDTGAGYLDGNGPTAVPKAVGDKLYQEVMK